jgi:hypothetical protein
MAYKEGNEITFDEGGEEDVQIAPEDNQIHTSTGNLEIESLFNKEKLGKLILQPDFQRQYVWDPSKASRLVESAILQIPLPIIYFSQDKDGKEYVIDGQQRLTSLFSFINGYFPPDGEGKTKAFRLIGLNIFSHLNGLKFSDLDEKFQDRIRYYKVHVITFLRESSENLKFEIFERLNTGSVQLNDQELRNCLYRGRFNGLLREMAQDPDFMYICGLKAPDKRMKDKELVLRFCAFYHMTYLKYKAPMRNFLNIEAREKRDISDEEISELKSAFKNSCQIIRSIFDTKSFKRYYKGKDGQPNGYWEPKKFNTSLYDILMYTFAKEDKNKVYQNLDSIKEALVFLMTEDQEFVESIELSTSSVQMVTVRFDKWRASLQSILGVNQKETRCFSFQLKEEMMAKDPTCAICNQKIQSADDAALDHIKQYWVGGRTIPENARLTHRYCNWARPRNESVLPV